MKKKQTSAKHTLTDIACPLTLLGLKPIKGDDNFKGWLDHNWNKLTSKIDRCQPSPFEAEPPEFPPYECIAHLLISISDGILKCATETNAEKLAILAYGVATKIAGPRQGDTLTFALTQNTLSVNDDFSWQPTSHELDLLTACWGMLYSAIETLASDRLDAVCLLEHFPGHTWSKLAKMLRCQDTEFKGREASSLADQIVDDLYIIADWFRANFTEASNTIVQVSQFLEGLDPERRRQDATIFCARLCASVWTELGMTKDTAADYVFFDAKDGDRLFAACKCARTYFDHYNFKISTVKKYANDIHSKQRKYKQDDGIARPETMRQAAKESRQEELEQLKAKQNRKR